MHSNSHQLTPGITVITHSSLHLRPANFLSNVSLVATAASLTSTGATYEPPSIPAPIITPVDRRVGTVSLRVIGSVFLHSSYSGSITLTFSFTLV